MLLLCGFLVNEKGFVFADSKEDELKKIEKEIDKTQNKISDLSKKITGIKSTIGNLKGSLSEILTTINSVEKELDDLDSSLTEVTTELNNKSATLAEYTVLRDRTLRNFYKKSPNNSFVALINSNAALSSSITVSSYLRKYIDDSTSFIQDVNQEISVNKKNKESLTEIKKDVEVERNKLLTIKKDTESKLAQQQADLNSSNSNLTSLNAKLGDLMAKQKQIISEKEGNFYASLGEGVQTDDPKSSPSYNPGFSPAFAAFSYGAFSHYKGMSQYGAKGRAESGKSYKDILKFYYKSDITEKDSAGGNICVEGYGNISFSKYLYGLAEMPSTWHKEALKAQAVAGRSYALRYKNSGKCICTSESCQVFNKGKSDNPPGEWKAAVDATEKEVLSSDVVAYFSSTTGGYIDGIGWDSNGGWPSGAYEAKGKSPWFYKSWYTKSYSISSDKCGRSSPWLNEKEMADILNSWLVFTKGSKDDRDNISPVTTSCWGGSPYSLDKMADKADDLGGKFTSVSSVSVSFSDNGRTGTVKFSTNRGSVSISGEEFKTVFNLRAPGYISIKSRLFDLKRK